jgi:dTDP-4-amino-4,6-dideoxygalactose transaminase
MKLHRNIPVVKPYLPDRAKYDKYLDELWDSRWLTNMGKFHNEYINRAKKYLDVPFIYPLLNGTAALETAIKTFGINNKEIITTPFTFVATTLAIINTGNIPVFCDVDPDTGNMDLDKAEKLITDNTAAILPVHIYGEPLDLDKLEKMCNKYDIFSIIDSAHAFGVKINEKGIGEFGDINAFSTHSTKLFHTIEGGLLTYSNPELDRIIKLSVNFGLQENYDLIYPGTNGKMNEFQCAMGLCILDDIDYLIEERKRLFDIYKKNLNEDIIFTKFNKKEVHYNYIYFIIKHPKRDLVYKNLLRKNITTRKYFNPLTSDYTLIKNMYKKNDNLPVAKNLSNEVLALPLYPGLKDSEILFICNQINKIK